MTSQQPPPYDEVISSPQTTPSSGLLALPSRRDRRHSRTPPASPNRSALPPILDCIVCSQSIDTTQGDGITINKKDYWHSRCNNCTLCGDALIKGVHAYTVKSRDLAFDLPVCKKCRDARTLCFECQEPARPPNRVSLKSLNRVYHSWCFKCASCDTTIDPTTPEAAFKKGEPFCPAHRSESRKRNISLSSLCPPIPASADLSTTLVASTSQGSSDIFRSYDSSEPSPGYSSLSFRDIRESMGLDPRLANERRITEIVWYKRREGVQHEYLVLRVSMPSGRDVFVRLDRGADREKGGMVSGVPIGSSSGSYAADDLVRISSAVEKLGIEKDRLLFRIVFPQRTPVLWVLGNILRAIEDIAPDYFIVDANCWVISTVVAGILKKEYDGVIAEGKKDLPHQLQGHRILSSVEKKFKEIQKADRFTPPHSPSPRVIDLTIR